MLRLSVIDKGRKCRARLALGAAMVALGGLRGFASSFIFSGNAESYSRFVRSMFTNWLITGSCAAGAAVVVVPVFWQGSKRQLAMAGFLFLLAALVFVLCISVIRDY